MIALDPKKLFARLAQDIPPPLHRHVFIVGSLAAAYHLRAGLQSRAVHTKDADVVVHPAGDIRSCRELTERLLQAGWVRTEECYPKARPNPRSGLRALRLHPRDSRDYFLELQGLAIGAQVANRVWIPVHLSDGWYGVPCYRFMGLTAVGRLSSKEGLEYAAPAMMALSNLLSHRTLGEARMRAAIQEREILRSAKDLGRVLALALLAGRDETERWRGLWLTGLRRCFPRTWRSLARRAGAGLVLLLADGAALEEARITTEVGLLSGRGVTAENLRAVGEQLVVDLLSPLQEATLSQR